MENRQSDSFKGESDGQIQRKNGRTDRRKTGHISKLYFAVIPQNIGQFDSVQYCCWIFEMWLELEFKHGFETWNLSNLNILEFKHTKYSAYKSLSGYENGRTQKLQTSLNNYYNF